MNMNYWQIKMRKVYSNQYKCMTINDVKGKLSGSRHVCDGLVLNCLVRGDAPDNFRFAHIYFLI